MSLLVDQFSHNLNPGSLKRRVGGARPFGLIDEYEFILQRRLAGHGPTLMAGLAKYVDLRLVEINGFARARGALR